MSRFLGITVGGKLATNSLLSMVAMQAPVKMNVSAQRRKAYDRLRDLLAEAEGATYEWILCDQLAQWRGNAETGLRRLFGEDSKHLRGFSQIRYTPAVNIGTSDDVLQLAFLEGLRNSRGIIRSAIQEFEDCELLSETDSAPQQGGVDHPHSTTIPRTVFLVHGRDEEVKQAVARFLERLRFSVVILHEQASGGATIIEKFEGNSDVSFAVVVLTPDDVGRLNIPETTLQPRARQNVVLELGYFIGRLGRKRVCAIVRGQLEIPSDFHGIEYIAYEGDSWKLRLVGELKHAGFDIDANEAF